MVAMTDPLADVDADPASLAALRAAVPRPVHAYLLVGAAGTGTTQAAIAFAAALLGPDDEVVRRVLAGVHPDVVVVERVGAYITMDAAREIARLAARSPMEGARKVLVLRDFHLVQDAGPALLKTIEEPPPSTIFVILAEYLPPELVTIASRCVRIEFAPLRREQVVARLVADGIGPAEAGELAEVAGGRLDRARLLAADPQFASRRQAWLDVPGRLDGSGATAARVADELLALLDASVAPLRARHEAESAALEERNLRAAEVNGKVGRGARSGLTAGVRDLEERQKREVRRQRTDELRTGLAILAGAYRDRLVDPATRDRAVAAVNRIDRLGADLIHNPGELLALQALLGRIGAAVPG
jgi:DNA polymerase-3 subunit delta'